MKTYARIQDGRVAELFATDGDITQMFHPALVWVEAGPDVSVGCSYVGGEFAAPQSEPQPAPTVPRSLTPRQIRLALSQMGYRDAVEAAVAAGPLALQDAWQYALEFLRNDPMVAQVLAAIGATPEQADQLWTLGATL